MAHGNFFPSMPLEQASDGQEVCGPIIWAGRDPWDLTALEVEIFSSSSPSSRAVGSSSA